MDTPEVPAPQPWNAARQMRVLALPPLAVSRTGVLWVVPSAGVALMVYDPAARPLVCQPSA
jgi:hypothetical protein